MLTITDVSDTKNLKLLIGGIPNDQEKQCTFLDELINQNITTIITSINTDADPQEVWQYLKKRTSIVNMNSYITYLKPDDKTTSLNQTETENESIICHTLTPTEQKKSTGITFYSLTLSKKESVENQTTKTTTNQVITREIQALNLNLSTLSTNEIKEIFQIANAPNQVILVHCSENMKDSIINILKGKDGLNSNLASTTSQKPINKTPPIDINSLPPSQRYMLEKKPSYIGILPPVLPSYDSRTASPANTLVSSTNVSTPSTPWNNASTPPHARSSFSSHPTTPNASTSNWRRSIDLSPNSRHNITPGKINSGNGNESGKRPDWKRASVANITTQSSKTPSPNNRPKSTRLLMIHNNPEIAETNNSYTANSYTTTNQMNSESISSSSPSSSSNPPPILSTNNNSTWQQTQSSNQRILQFLKTRIVDESKTYAINVIDALLELISASANDQLRCTRKLFAKLNALNDLFPKESINKFIQDHFQFNPRNTSNTVVQEISSKTYNEICEGAKETLLKTYHCDDYMRTMDSINRRITSFLGEDTPDNKKLVYAKCVLTSLESIAESTFNNIGIKQLLNLNQSLEIYINKLSKLHPELSSSQPTDKPYKLTDSEMQPLTAFIKAAKSLVEGNQVTFSLKQ